jgi:hypothetical protein
MIWLTWRQFRAQAITAAAALAATAVALGLAGLHIAHLYHISGVAGCHSHGDCGTVTSNFLGLVNASLVNHLPLLFGTALIAIPAVIGIFWGAPLVTRELEAGTHRLAWSQSVSRTRWLAVKLGVIVAAGMATAGLFSLMVTWSASHIDAVNTNRLLPATFSERGIAPAGYAAFAVLLGVATGMLIRRTLPAMAVSLAIFTAVQFIMRALRDGLLAPAHLITAITATAGTAVGVQPGGPGSLPLGANVSIPDAWILSVQVINSAGRGVRGTFVPGGGAAAAQTCGTGSANASRECFADIARRGLRLLVTYQPGSRFWAFQWYETAIFLGLAAVLAGFCFWWIRRRLS